MENVHTDVRLYFRVYSLVTHNCQIHLITEVFNPFHNLLRSDIQMKASTWHENTFKYLYVMAL